MKILGTNAPRAKEHLLGPVITTLIPRMETPSMTGAFSASLAPPIATAMLVSISSRRRYKGTGMATFSRTPRFSAPAMATFQRAGRSTIRQNPRGQQLRQVPAASPMTARWNTLLYLCARDLVHQGGFVTAHDRLRLFGRPKRFDSVRCFKRVIPADSCCLSVASSLKCVCVQTFLPLTVENLIECRNRAHSNSMPDRASPS